MRVVEEALDQDLAVGLAARSFLTENQVLFNCIWDCGLLGIRLTRIELNREEKIHLFLQRG